MSVTESAQSAPPGEHTDQITVNSGIAGGNAEVSLKLNVSPLPCEFTADAPPDLDFRRNTDGSFTSLKTIELRNAVHRQDCPWLIVPPPWLSVTPAAGVLAGGATQSVQVAVIEQIATTLARHQVHNGVINFIGQSEIPADLQFPATLEMGCVDADPCVKIHSNRKKITYGEEATLTLTMRNPLDRPELTVTLTLALPDGWEFGPGDFNADCSSSECSKPYGVAAGQSEDEDIEITALPTAPSSEKRDSVFTGNVSYVSAAGGVPQSYEISIPVVVDPAPPDIIADHRATDTPPAAPAVAPTPSPASPAAVNPIQPSDSGPASDTNPTPAPASFLQDWRVVWGATFLVVIAGAMVVLAVLWRRNASSKNRRRGRGRRQRQRPRRTLDSES